MLKTTLISTLFLTFCFSVVFGGGEAGNVNKRFFGTWASSSNIDLRVVAELRSDGRFISWVYPRFNSPVSVTTGKWFVRDDAFVWVYDRDMPGIGEAGTEDINPIRKITPDMFTINEMLRPIVSTFTKVTNHGHVPMTVTASRLRVRAQPSTGSPTIGSLETNETVQVVRASTFSQTIEGKTAPWVEFPFQDGTGWGFSGFMTIMGVLPDEPIAELRLIIPGTTDLLFSRERLEGWSAIQCKEVKCTASPAIVTIEDIPPSKRNSIYESPSNVNSDPEATFLVKGRNLPQEFPGVVLGTTSYNDYRDRPAASPMPFDLTLSGKEAHLGVEKSGQGKSILWHHEGAVQDLFPGNPHFYDAAIVWQGDMNLDGVFDFLMLAHFEGECSATFFELFVSKGKSGVFEMEPSGSFRKASHCSY